MFLNHCFRQTFTYNNNYSFKSKSFKTILQFCGKKFFQTIPAHTYQRVLVRVPATQVRVRWYAFPPPRSESFGTRSRHPGQRALVRVCPKGSWYASRPHVPKGLGTRVSQRALVHEGSDTQVPKTRRHHMHQCARTCSRREARRITAPVGRQASHSPRRVRLVGGLSGTIVFSSTQWAYKAAIRRTRAAGSSSGSQQQQ